MDNSLFGDFVYTTASKIFSLQPVIDPSLPNQFIQCVGVTTANAAPPGDHSKVVTESQPGHHFCWSNTCSVFQHCHMPSMWTPRNLYSSTPPTSCPRTESPLSSEADYHLSGLIHIQNSTKSSTSALSSSCLSLILHIQPEFSWRWHDLELYQTSICTGWTGIEIAWSPLELLYCTLTNSKERYPISHTVACLVFGNLWDGGRVYWHFL